MVTRVRIRFVVASFLVATSFARACTYSEHSQSAGGVGYARGFSFDVLPSGDTELITYSPTQRRYRVGDTLDITDTLLVFPRIPKRVVCLSTTQLPFLQILGCEESIVGVAGVRYISSPSLRAKVETGDIIDVGEPPNLHYEKILALAPDLVLAYSATISSDFVSRLEKLQIPVLVINEYLENHPLGRAEWLEVFGYLFNQRELARTILDTVSSSYLEQVVDVSPATRSTVLLNFPWKEIWYIPGSESYMAQFIRDAGGEVLLSSKYADAKSHAIPREEILLQGMEAMYWLNPGVCETLDEFVDFATFRAVRTHHVYNNTRRYWKGRGNDFYESGVLLPHIILRDLVRILHPECSSDTTPLVFYKRLD